MSEAILLRVEGMSCSGCVKSVERAAKSVDPNAEISVDLASGEVRIENAATQATRFAEVIAKAGYDVAI